MIGHYDHSAETVLIAAVIAGGCGSAISTLVARYGVACLQGLSDMDVAHLQSLGISEKQAIRLFDALRNYRAIQNLIELLDKNAIVPIFRWSAQYPILLEQITYPPLILFCRGDASQLMQAGLAGVGSRLADRYALRIAQGLAAAVPATIPLISGGALGADTYVHESALAAGRKTIAVLGSGLLMPYPRANKRLFETIVAQGGCVVSAFLPSAHPLPAQFPARNRIIAGLSRAVVVIQAATRSGALITAEFALQSGREVFAVPGNIDSPLSAGCHSLLAQGATLLYDMHQIQQFFGIDITVEKKEVLPCLQQPQKIDPLLDMCSMPRSVDELSRLLQLDYTALFARLHDLQDAGYIEQLMTGQWKALS